ncbi:shikimate dehydrogenase [Xanthobacter dioxanivorans]|uniref:Shikimate dehydrogenase (NADP(+)) n=1 Tax=Xanthobacter dioxanivorans TaxID=2528964 RepID=A0A974PRX2_9HYPH|nr:shikimate dehydrogenase [Xanthobacter dioxanivorans]QRG08193.1 shikimate dehydrogenase [Xanthobacter dioxanivorans]
MSVRVCVTGQPVSYSRSPLLHGYWLRKYGIDGAYGREEVPPSEAVDFYRSLATRGYVGCNVTAPNKEIAFSVLDEAEESAATLGAANTLWLEDGRLCGASTDGYGFIANLDAGALGWDGERKTALVLGAGGASRAIVHALVARGFERVALANRTLERAEAIAAMFGPVVRPLALERIGDVMRDADVLVNCTSLGMKGAAPLLLDLSGLRPEAVVSDIVYVPLVTPLLKMAAGQGFRTVDGLGMLLHQGVPGFERWFGVRPEVTPELRALLVADLKAKGQLEA